jgi:tetratricopeptide (TPR) repeat protein
MNGNYYHNRAQVKARLDKLEEAIDDYNKALEYLTETNHKY